MTCQRPRERLRRSVRRLAEPLGVALDAFVAPPGSSPIRPSSASYVSTRERRPGQSLALERRPSRLVAFIVSRWLSARARQRHPLPGPVKRVWGEQPHEPGRRPPIAESAPASTTVSRLTRAPCPRLFGDPLAARTRPGYVRCGPLPRERLRQPHRHGRCRKPPERIPRPIPPTSTR